METIEKLNPLVDFAFKKLFGVDENKDILIDLINAIVSEEDKIVDLEIKNPYNAKAFKNDKLSILDIKARGANKKWYVIEMQVIDQQYFDSRALYYWSRVYHGQLANGINYDCLEKTISINFLNFNCLDEENYHNTYKLMNQHSFKLYPNDHVELHFIELKKYHQSFSTMLDKWTNFLIKAYEYSKQYLPQELQIPSIEKAMDVLEHMSLTNEERESYEARLKWLRDEEMALKKAKQDGIKIGEQRGIKIGEQRGIGIGEQKGRQEAQLEIAKELLKKGFDREIILSTTCLTQDQIDQLNKFLEKY